MNWDSEDNRPTTNEWLDKLDHSLRERAMKAQNTTKCNCFVDEDGNATICHSCVVKMRTYIEERSKAEKYTRADVEEMAESLETLMSIHQNTFGSKMYTDLQRVVNYLKFLFNRIDDVPPDMYHLPTAWIEVTDTGVSGGPID